MRIRKKLVALMGAGLLLACASVRAQYTILHDFNLGSTDGAIPVSSLTLSGNTLYGLTSVGINNATGMLFRINVDGSGYTNLINGIGFRSVIGSLQVSGASIYGVRRESFFPQGPTLFRVNTDGTGFTVLFDFSSVNSSPVDTLTLSGSTFYGFSEFPGTIFRINTDGTGYTTLYTFGAFGDGNRPVGSPAVSGNTLYGMCRSGGANDAGIVFRINTDGTGYTILHSFTFGDSNPFGSLKLSGSTLYGITFRTPFVGQPFARKLFKINTDGSGYTVLHDFTNDSVGALTGDLKLLGTTLYGMTSGAVEGTDTVFAINTSGSGFTVLHSLAGAPNDGSAPVGSPVLSGTTLFGLTEGGGAFSFGTVFSLPIAGTTPGGVPTACLPTTQPAQHSLSITRNSLYWFTHAFSDNPACATLHRAIEANGGTMKIGFLCLPTANRNSDNELDAVDALVEALGFSYRGTKTTGELGGTQSGRLPGSKVCAARKKLAVELIAAIANNVLLGTSPENATFDNGGTRGTFPADLIEQAGIVAAGDDPLAMQVMTLFLRKFNASGVANNFPAGLVECSADSRSFLRTVSRDPTTQITCPGLNNSCESAEAVFFPATSGPFTPAVFRRQVKLYNMYTDSFASPACGPGGRDAVWKVTPGVGHVGRQFTVSTAGSNLDTVLSIWRGSCGSLVEVSCNNDAAPFATSQLTFTTDGINTFYIVAEGVGDQVGKLKVRITSP